MIPVLTPEEMGDVDRSAPEPVEVLIGRAGAATARAAKRMLGGTYGRRVVIVAGKGKAEAVRRVITGDESAETCPARVLVGHPRVTLLLDDAAAALL